MVSIGNFLFRFRNIFFPLCFGLALVGRTSLLPSERLAFAIGFAIALSGQILRALTIGLAYIKRGGKKRRIYAEGLVTDGIFAHCRNPLYLGNILIIIGVGTAINSFWFAVGGGIFFIFAYYAIVAAEENFLQEKFGNVYDEYCKDVNRFMPRLHGMASTIRSMKFHWKRLVVKEYGTTFSWFAGLCMIQLLKDTCLASESHLHSDMGLLWGGLIFLAILLYGVTRFLKKSSIIRAD
jgi:protein-S-isoprenylcysteine O-methyltransferase Ste14